MLTFDRSSRRRRSVAPVEGAQDPYRIASQGVSKPPFIALNESDTRAICTEAARTLVTAIRADRAVVAYLDDDQIFTLGGSDGFPPFTMQNAPISMSVLEDAALSGRATLSSDARFDQETRQNLTLQLSQAVSMLCVPIYDPSSRRPRGALYADTINRPRAFRQGEVTYARECASWLANCLSGKAPAPRPRPDAAPATAQQSQGRTKVDRSGAKQLAPPAAHPVPQGAADDWRQELKCSRQTVILFTRQLNCLVSSTGNILPSLRTLEVQEGPRFGSVVVDVAGRVEGGRYLSEALSQFPRIFSHVYVAVIRVGESTGKLAAMLALLSDWLEDDEALVRKAKASLSYPVLVATVAGVLTLLLFLYVMPGFVTIFQGMDVRLPLITQILILLTNLVTNPWVLLATVTAAAVSFPRLVAYSRTPVGELALFELILRIPLVGPIVKQLNISRFCCAAAATIASGLPIQTALTLACHASGSPVLRVEAESLTGAIGDGEQISAYMADRPSLYPRALAQVFEVGEQTGKLDHLLHHIARLYQEDVVRRLDGLGAALEPIFLLLAAFVVGAVLLGIFLPLYGLVGNL